MELKKYANWSRSRKLFLSFFKEQSKPEEFYEPLAKDTFNFIQKTLQDFGSTKLERKKVLDIGGGPGYFAKEFVKSGNSYTNIELDQNEIDKAKKNNIDFNIIKASGMQLPIQDNSIDVCFSSNVAEHINKPFKMADEMVRVIKPGGFMFLSYTLWYGPFGGHELGLWHYFGAKFATKKYMKKYKQKPKNYFGKNLFKVTVKEGLDWVNALNKSELKLCVFAPRYLPFSIWWIMKIPIIREVFGSNLLIVLQKK